MAFDEVYTRGPAEADVIVASVDDVDDLDSIAGFEIVREPPADIDLAYWRVSRVWQADGHWQIDLESVDGDDFFAGSVFVRFDDDEAIIVSPESLGLTGTTSVS